MLRSALRHWVDVVRVVPGRYVEAGVALGQRDDAKCLAGHALRTAALPLIWVSFSRALGRVNSLPQPMKELRAVTSNTAIATQLGCCSNVRQPNPM